MQMNPFKILTNSNNMKISNEKVYFIENYQAINLFASLLYYFVFIDIYRTYISIEWGYTGLIYRPLITSEYIFSLVSVTIVSAALPERILSPSAMITWIFFVFIHVPTIGITFMVGGRESWNYMPSLAAMSVIMVFAGRLANRNSKKSAAHLAPDAQFVTIIIGIFILTTSVIYYNFRGILRFSDLSDVYFQRFLASDLGGGPLDYVRTNYANVVTPLLIATGLLGKRCRYLIVLGIVASVLSYMIDGSKVALFLPIIMIAIFIFSRLARNQCYLYTFALSTLVFACSFLVERVAALKLFVDLLVFRSMAIPAQTFAQYSDLFSARGHTYWSNVRGIDLLISPPAGYISDPYWPSLGRIVGAEYVGFGSQQDSNANFFVGEGVAAADYLGVLVIGAAFILWLHFLDRASRRWNYEFTSLCAIPIALSLCNVHLSTLLLSFGGLLLVLILQFYQFKEYTPAVKLSPV